MTTAQLSPEMADEIVRMAATGSTHTTICDALGIDPADMADWIGHGKEVVKHGVTGPSFDPYRAIYDGIRRQRARIKIAMEGKIIQAANEGDYRAALAYLERKYPEEWGRQDRTPIGAEEYVIRLAKRAGMTESDIFSLMHAEPAQLPAYDDGEPPAQTYQHDGLPDEN